MSAVAVLAQATTPDSSSAAAAVFGVVALVGIFSVIAVTSRGRRMLLPLVAVLLGASIAATTVTEWQTSNTFSALTLIGFFFGGILIIGGVGALRESAGLPEVEGVEPEIHPQPPRITPGD